MKNYRIETEEEYNVMSAIRGPDVGGEFFSFLKHLFTARIREVVRAGEAPVFYEYREDIGDRWINMLAERKQFEQFIMKSAKGATGHYEDLGRPLSHFMTHVKVSLNALKDQMDEKEWILLMVLARKMEPIYGIFACSHCRDEAVEAWINLLEVYGQSVEEEKAWSKRKGHYPDPKERGHDDMMGVMREHIENEFVTPDWWPKSGRSSS